jgi:hypothetical protein
MSLPSIRTVTCWPARRPPTENFCLATEMRPCRRRSARPRWVCHGLWSDVWVDDLGLGTEAETGDGAKHPERLVGPAVVVLVDKDVESRLRLLDRREGVLGEEVSATRRNSLNCENAHSRSSEALSAQSHLVSLDPISAVVCWIFIGFSAPMTPLHFGCRSNSDAIWLM